MTRNKHLKQHIRARMEKTGERYAAARRQLVGANVDAGPAPDAAPYFAGSIPAPTALRILLAASGALDSATNAPLTEQTLFGLAGGIGIGVFTFLYEKDDFASFFIGGRCLWHDDQAYLRAACDRLGIATETRETGGSKTAMRDLHELLERGPCIAWVDPGGLPHRSSRNDMDGGGYHVVSVHQITPAGDVVIGDMANDLIAVSGSQFLAARSRVRKFKHRLMAIDSAPAQIDTNDLSSAAIAACVAGLHGDGAFNRSRRNFTLDAIKDWADELSGTGQKSWARRFPRGHRLWTGLTMMYEFIELAGTGGGLCRPIFADYLHEVSRGRNRPDLKDLAERYSALGQDWSDLADAALPTGILTDVRDLMVERAELRTASPTELDRIAATNVAIGKLADEAGKEFPLTEGACHDLRNTLSQRVAAIHAEEAALLDKLTTASSIEQTLDR